MNMTVMIMPSRAQSALCVRRRGQHHYRDGQVAHAAFRICACLGIAYAASAASARSDLAYLVDNISDYDAAPHAPHRQLLATQLLQRPMSDVGAFLSVRQLTPGTNSVSWVSPGCRGSSFFCPLQAAFSSAVCTMSCSCSESILACNQPAQSALALQLDMMPDVPLIAVMHMT